jgi:hypothetical protein
MLRGRGVRAIAAAALAGALLASCSGPGLKWKLAEGDGEVGAILQTDTGQPQISVGCISGRSELVVQVRAFPELERDITHRVNVKMGDFQQGIDATVVGTPMAPRVQLMVPATRDAIAGVKTGIISVSAGDDMWSAEGRDPDGVLAAFEAQCLTYAPV